jgi:hypothetical protein
MDSRPGDETLLLAVAEHELGAFRTLYERHAGWLAIRLARRCNDRDLVADAIQDTFVAVWQRPQGFRGDGDIAAWLWGIAIRRLVSRVRTRSSVAAVFEHAGAAVVLVLMAPSLVPQIARWVRMFPAPGTGGQFPDHVWWTVLAVCVVAIAISVGGRSLPRWMSSVPGEATP